MKYKCVVDSIVCHHHPFDFKTSFAAASGIAYGVPVVVLVER